MDSYVYYIFYFQRFVLGSCCAAPTLGELSPDTVAAADDISASAAGASYSLY